VRVRATPAIYPLARRRDGSPGRDLDREDLHAIDPHHAAVDRTARNGSAGDHQRDTMRVGIRPVSMMRAHDRPVAAHADEYDAAMTVREANDRVHQLLIGERVILLGDELGGELFAARYESANVGIGEHDGAREIEDSHASVRVMRSSASGLASYPVARPGQPGLPESPHCRVIPTPAVMPVYAPPSTATLPFTITYFIPVASSVGF
jgi:hypothetical protein